MSTSRRRSLSERLDRDGAEAVLRKAKEVGGDAPGIADRYVALQRRLETLRSLDGKTRVSDDELAAVVTRLESRLATGGEVDDSAAMRKPPFPETEEETKAMADDLSAGSDAGSQAPPAEVQQSTKSAVPAAPAATATPAAPAVKRTKETEKSDSGVVNLKALAEDYYRAKAQREAVATSPAAEAVAAGEASAKPRRKQSLGVFFAVAAGLVAVCGVLVYLLMSHGGGDGDKTPPSPTASSVAAGPSVMSAPPAERPAVEMPPPPPDNANEEELAKYREEVERLKAELAAQEAGKAAPTAPAEAAAAAETGAETSRPATTGSGASRPRAGTTPTRPATGGSTPPPGTPATTPADAGANPLISMLGGRPTQGGSGSGSTAPARDAGAATSGTGGTTNPDERVVGSMAALGGRPEQPAEPTAPAAPAVVAPPPPPPPPEENLPETLGRPEMRRGADSVSSAVKGCGSGNTGTIIVEFTVSGTTGAVTGTRVNGDFAGTAIGACAESAARNATFARFRRASFTFTFPFMLPTQ